MLKLIKEKLNYLNLLYKVKIGNVVTRCLIAISLDCPKPLMELLAYDKDWLVRYELAHNPNCPVHLLEKLSLENLSIAHRGVLHNPNCPQYLKDYIMMRFFISHSIEHYPY
jgi:hypothetical protein